MPSPDKPGAKPTEPMEVQVEERDEDEYENLPSEDEDENIKVEVDLPLSSATPKFEVLPTEEEEEPVKIEVMLPLHSSKGPESAEARRLLSVERSPSRSSGSSKSSESRKSREVRDASVSPNKKALPLCKITTSPETEGDGGLGTPSRSRKKSKTPEKDRSPKQLSLPGEACALSPGGSKSEMGQLLSPKSPKSPKSPIKELVEGIGRVGRMVREHSPRSLREIFTKSKKDDRGSDDEEQPLITIGTPKHGKKSKSGKSKKSKNKSPKPEDANKSTDDKIHTMTDLLESDTESDKTNSTELTLSSSTSEMKDEKGLPNVPEIAIGESKEMDTDDEQQKSLSDNEPESPVKTTSPLPEKVAEELPGESSTNQRETESAEVISDEKMPKPERRLPRDLNLDELKDEAFGSPSKRPKTDP